MVRARTLIILRYGFESHLVYNSNTKENIVKKIMKLTPIIKTPQLIPVTIVKINPFIIGTLILGLSRITGLPKSTCCDILALIREGDPQTIYTIQSRAVLLKEFLQNNSCTVE